MSRVTIQDIADALGVSRNTVSKAMNNTPGLAPATREKILQKATELGYKQFSYLSDRLSAPAPEPAASAQAPEPEAVQAPREIALLTKGFVGGTHFAVTMLDRFQRELSQAGYGMSMHRITDEEVAQLRLPPTFRKERTCGILCVEVFRQDYANMLTALGLPVLFVDAPVPQNAEPLRSDVLLMDNRTAVFQFVKHMLDTGRTRIGYIGTVLHCQSFCERYLAYRNALYLYGGTIEERFCITDICPGQDYPSDEDYHSFLTAQISAMKELPDVFLCANDWIAVQVLRVLRELGRSVPEDVQICGFDDSSEAKIVQPPLTTIRIHNQTMGHAAFDLMMSRMREPELNFRTTYVETNLVYRSSAPY